MLTIGIIIILIMGLLIVCLISKELSCIEKIGLSFPVGIGVQTMLMALINLCGLRLTAISVLSSGLLMLFVLLVLLFRRNSQTHLHPIQGLDTSKYLLVELN